MEDEPHALARCALRVARARAGELSNEMRLWRQLDASIRRATAEYMIVRAPKRFWARAAERVWFNELRAYVEQTP